jgi:hypothetical protein
MQWRKRELEYRKGEEKSVEEEREGREGGGRVHDEERRGRKGRVRTRRRNSEDLVIISVHRPAFMRFQAVNFT